MTPKKPNSALRHILRVEIYKTKRNLIARIPGNDLWPVKFNRTLIEGGRANDLPIVRYTSIRGKFDVAGFFMRKKKEDLFTVLEDQKVIQHTLEENLENWVMFSFF